ncbi:MAG: phosphotransferase [Verrucomicrobiales bacterium]|nr:phosphotransferase [Verrucomicrobiales bacterium]
MPLLDIEQPGPLLEWLRRSGRIASSESPQVRVLAGGVSNRTVLVSRARGDSWVLKQALDQLRVAAPWFCSPERIHREALGMRWLSTLAPPNAVPALVFEDRENFVLAMRAVPEPHENWKTLLLEGRVDPEHVRQFGQILGSIHRRSRQVAHRLEIVFADPRFFEALRVDPFYRHAAERHPEAKPFLDALVAETRAERSALVHGDYSPKNILVHQGQLVLLDHEVVHWGDPMFDVGFALAHFLCKAHRAPDRREAFAGAAVLFWEHYAFAACDCFAHATCQARAVRHGLACLLARVSGKSPVDYLGPVQKERQRRICLGMVSRPPPDVVGLADAFLRGLGDANEG